MRSKAFENMLSISLYTKENKAMEKANTDELWTLFQETSLEELTDRVNESENPKEIRLFKL